MPRFVQSRSPRRWPTDPEKPGEGRPAGQVRPLEPDGRYQRASTWKALTGGKPRRSWPGRGNTALYK